MLPRKFTVVSWVSNGSQEVQSMMILFTRRSSDSHVKLICVLIKNRYRFYIHMLKLCLKCWSLFSARERFAPSAPRRREAQAQAEAPRATPQQLLHGRQVPRLLQDHDGLQSRADGRALRRLQHRPMPTHGGKGQAHRR